MDLYFSRFPFLQNKKKKIKKNKKKIVKVIRFNRQSLHYSFSSVLYADICIFQCE